MGCCHIVHGERSVRAAAWVIDEDRLDETVNKQVLIDNAVAGARCHVNTQRNGARRAVARARRDERLRVGRKYRLDCQLLLHHGICCKLLFNGCTHTRDS
jgi:hypothetical protein